MKMKTKALDKVNRYFTLLFLFGKDKYTNERKKIEKKTTTSRKRFEFQNYDF